MKLGVCYYPEHWPRQRWATDARMMRQAGLSIVRIADFAWAAIEPREGIFSWEWLDEAIETLAAEKLRIVMCTPTASPPPWLCRAHPDILPVDEQGRRRRPGSRRHYCPNNVTYRQYSERIVTELASRFGEHPAVIGWQIDNEFGCHYTDKCYCESCASAFRRWLQARYGTIDALNEAWGTIFWGQIYNDWSEIDPPNLTVAGPNPGHQLDYTRFSSGSYIDYLEAQKATLQPLIVESQLLTTNFMGRFSGLDYFQLGRSIDVVSMSSYPTGHGETAAALYLPSSERRGFAYDVGDPYLTAMEHTLMRGFKQGRHFWVMEQQAGNVNWGVYNTGVRPGTVRLWTWHALASGAEAVLYFRWRACLVGLEQMHSGLMRHDGSPGAAVDDLKRMADERELMAEIAAEKVQAKIALLLDYDSLWATQIQPHNRDFDPMRLLFVYYRALLRLGMPADIVSADADLSAYRIVIAPSAIMATQSQVASIRTFAEEGGTFLLGVRSGFKTVDNRVNEEPLPGIFRELAGISVTDWHSLAPGVSFDVDSSIPGLAGPATIWAEALADANGASRLASSSQRTLARYSSGTFASMAALSENSVGNGRALYLGWHPSDSQAESLLAHLADQVEISALATVPEGMIVSKRGDRLILLNFNDEPARAIIQGRPVEVGARDVKVVE
jgi:beta-galactosidase